jgi:exopolysaccharide biosynthesis polyprenyl glycosylphosphotransferase
MFLRLEALAPVVTRRLNLAADCGVLVLASTVCANTTEHVSRREATLAAVMVAISVRLLGGLLLREYEGWKGQGIGPTLALTLTLALGITGAVALLRAAVPAYAAAMTLRDFVAVALPGMLLLRASIPTLWTFARRAPADVLIVGTGPLARHTAQQIQDQRALRSVCSFLSFPDEQRKGGLPGPLLGTSDDLERVLGERPFNEVYLAGSSLRHGAAMQTAIRICERFGVPFALPANHFRFDRARPTGSAAVSDGYVHYLSVEHKPYQMAVKRVFDVLVSGGVLLLLSPLLLVVSVLILVLCSPGDILFRQQRVGRHGRTFNMLKFRTMVVDAEARKASLQALNEQSGPVFKIKDDPRVTPLGRFLRRFSIDELPQFFNVLRGDMSIVGPRPPVPSEVARYEAWQRRRLSVLPGITCVWQVSGRNEISFEEWMYLDMRYIDHWSLTEDIKLILKTVPVVVTGRGAS